MMKAIGYTKSLPASDPNCLIDIEVPTPKPIGHDVLVRVQAISVNPVDTKIRQRKESADAEPIILGWDVAGIVESVGDQVQMFSPGDEIWYAGAIDRPGCNAEFHLVDERIISQKPKTLSFAEAAALPLTTITAWELLFDRLQVTADTKGGLLVVGAGGGVGSILVQLAKQRTGLTVIGTASRPETVAWVQSLGADHVINHHEPLLTQIEPLNIAVEYIASLTQTGGYLEQYVDVIAPQGKIAVIDDPPALDIMPFKAKSVSWHWEFMFARSLFQTADMVMQHELLKTVAALVDQGRIRTTVSESYGTINAENLRRAHELIEAGKSRGKIVLSGF